MSSCCCGLVVLEGRKRAAAAPVVRSFAVHVTRSIVVTWAVRLLFDDALRYDGCSGFLLQTSTRRHGDNRRNMRTYKTILRQTRHLNVTVTSLITWCAHRLGRRVPERADENANEGDEHIEENQHVNDDLKRHDGHYVIVASAEKTTETQ